MEEFLKRPWRLILPAFRIGPTIKVMAIPAMRRGRIVTDMKTLADKLWSMVGTPDENGCRHFLGSRNYQGYGRFKHGGKHISAHRTAWLLTYLGPIFPRSDFKHSCDAKSCCEPSHISPGTHAANMAEAVERHRIPTGAAHPKSKFSNLDILDIRRLLSIGMSHRMLAAVYNTTTSNISCIRNRKTWVYV